MPHTDMEDQEKVSLNISELDNQYDFVLLSEHFDESFVLLAIIGILVLNSIGWKRLHECKAPPTFSPMNKSPVDFCPTLYEI